MEEGERIVCTVEMTRIDPNRDKGINVNVMFLKIWIRNVSVLLLYCV